MNSKSTRALLKNWVTPFNPAEIRDRIHEYDLMASEPDFWNDQERSQKIMVEQGALKNKLAEYEHVVSSYDDACTPWRSLRQAIMPTVCRHF